MDLDEFCVLKGISIDSLLTEIKGEFAPELVVIGGSLVEGFGNATSDLDIYCFTSASLERAVDFQLVGGDSTFYRQLRYIGEVRADLKILPIRQLKALGNALMSANVGKCGLQEILISDELLITAHRITCGLTVCRTQRGACLESVLLKIKDQLRAYVVSLCAFRRNVNRTMAAEETNSFVYRLRTAVRAIEAEIDRQLACHGQLNVRFDKWRRHKARAIASFYPQIELALEELDEQLLTSAQLIDSLIFIDKKLKQLMTMA